MKLIEKRKKFKTCKEALDFINKLSKKKIGNRKIIGNLHSHLTKQKYIFTWSVTWKGKAK